MENLNELLGLELNPHLGGEEVYLISIGMYGVFHKPICGFCNNSKFEYTEKSETLLNPNELLIPFGIRDELGDGYYGRHRINFHSNEVSYLKQIDFRINDAGGYLGNIRLNYADMQYSIAIMNTIEVDFIIIYKGIRINTYNGTILTSIRPLLKRYLTEKPIFNTETNNNYMIEYKIHDDNEVLHNMI